MFQVKENQSVGFESQWKVKRVLCESASQTTEYNTNEIAITTSNSTESETQTDDKPPPPAVADYDVEKLSKWLNRIYPMVKKDIDDANNSQAFKGYRLIGDDVEPVCKLLQTIEVPAYSKTESDFRRVSAVSWNCTGQVLAVASNYTHTSWCYHGGIVGIFPLDSKDMLPQLPNRTLKSESCIFTVCYHPNMRSILAGGTINGEVIVWDTNQDDSEDVIAKVSAHDNNINSLLWVQDIDVAKIFLLATASEDGLLNIWNLNMSKSELNNKQRFKIKSPVFSSNKITPDTPEHNIMQRGITCFDFSSHIPDLFVVCLEGGLVVHCSIIGAKLLKASSDNLPVLDPVFKYYEPHDGDVLYVQFSPNRKDMFLTSGVDGQIRVYLIEQIEPAQTIFVENHLNTCLWVPFEEKLIVGCGSEGRIQLYHVQEGREIEEATEAKKEDTVWMQMDINKKRSSLMAVGDNKGNLYLWSCPWHSFIVNKL